MEIWGKLGTDVGGSESSETCFVSMSGGLGCVGQWNLSLCSRGSSFSLVTYPNPVFLLYAYEHNICVVSSKLLHKSVLLWKLLQLTIVFQGFLTS